MLVGNKEMGFESAFLESWEDWDQPLDFGIQFYNCKFRADVFPQDVVDDCDIMMASFDQGVLEVYHKEDTRGVPYKTFKFKMTLEV